MHNYMYVRIKFHTYSDIIMAKCAIMSCKRDLQQLKNLSEIHKLQLKMTAPHFIGNRPGLHAPRTQQHLQQTSSSFVFSEQCGYSKSEHMSYSASILENK